MFRKLFYSLGLIIGATYGQSQYVMPGSQVDLSGHGCVIDGGYQWCEELNTCVRPWEVSCPTSVITITDPLPPTPVKDCSMCHPLPCAEPYFPNMDNCRIVTDRDECGCSTSCPHYDCTNDNCNSDSDCRENQFCRPMQIRYPSANGRRTQSSLSECVDKVGINETCGGYTPPEYQTRCLDNLECVNTMGPMIADAPGQCKEPCLRGESRNQYGECVSLNTQIRIPDNCATWHDGCNTCQVRDGRAEICTLMYCFRQDTPYCMSYHINSNSLSLGDVCYRFCEDGSQEGVNRRSDCPSNTVCKSLLDEQSTSMISFDSCGERAWTCASMGH